MPAPEFDTKSLHALLDKAEAEFAKLFDGHVPDEHHRFKSFLATVRMVADQAADRSGKGE